jgi:hypothetical protein
MIKRAGSSRPLGSDQGWWIGCGNSAQIEVFEWSGANSVFERDTAAERLRDIFAASEDETTIIAHSHGGWWERSNEGNSPTRRRKSEN